MRDLPPRPAVELRDLLRAREISSGELTRAAISRRQALNPAINAIVAFDDDAALAAADESDRRLAAGNARPLEGLPITVKDAFDVAGLVSTAGAPALRGRVPDADASPVARLRAAGAIICGKTNTPVFSGDFQAFNPLYGVTRHPWRADCSPGGSSGGAAAAVATGMAALELGSDLGGSIRWPAHCCGLFGLKTTWGLVSTFGHVPPPPERRMARNPELLVAGPIARSAADLALALGVIAGPRDPREAARPLAPARRDSPEELRVAVWLDDPLAPVDSSVTEAVRRAASALESAGARVDFSARPGFAFAEAWEVAAVINHAVLAYGWPAKLRDRLAAMAKGFARGDLSHPALQARGARLTPGDYNDLAMRRLALKRKWERFFTRHDVLLCPPAPVGPIVHDHAPDIHARRLRVDGREIPYLDFLKWSALATGADLPAAAAPVGLGPDGLPRGVQIIAAEGEDHAAIAVAAMLERLLGGFLAPPGAAFR